MVRGKSDSKGLLSITEARAILARHRIKPGLETVPLRNSVGRYLAKTVRADRDVPPFDRSAVDGYAVRLAGPWKETNDFPVLGMVAAGESWSGTLKQGCAIQVMTGAPVPKGADGMVMVERSQRLDDDRVRLTGPFVKKPRQGVAPRGEDARKGEPVLLPGTRIEPAHQAILAAVGCVDVPVYRRASVSIVTTGDEVVEPSQRPEPAQIRNSNGPQIESMISAAGLASKIRRRRARDTEASIRRAIAAASDSDVLVLTGGVSMGEFDLVPEILREAGYRIRFHKVELRPGKPLLFGTRSRTAAMRGSRGRIQAVFGLPGNPVSVLVTGWEFLIPYLRQAGGCPDPDPPSLEARIETALRRKKGLNHFILGRMYRAPSGELWVREVPYHGSGDYLAVAWADCLIFLSGDVPKADPGDRLRVHPIFREAMQIPAIPASTTRAMIKKT